MSVAVLYQILSLAALLLLLTAWALAGTAIGLGLRLDLGSTRAGHRERGERWLVRIALGASGWVLVLLLFSVIGWLTTLSVSVLLALSFLAGGTGLWLLGAQRPELTAARDEERGGLSRAPGLVLASSLSVIGGGLLLQALRPDVSWDASVYHLTLPRLFLEHGGLYRVSFNVYSNWPLGIELLFAAAMAVRDYVLAKLVHFAFGALTAIAIYLLAGRGRGLLAASFFLFNPVVLFEIRVAYVDLAYAFFLLLATWNLSHALDHPLGSNDRRHHLLLCGVFAGVLCAVKLSGFFGLAVLGVLYLGDRLLAPSRHRRALSFAKPASRLSELLLLGLPSIAFGLPWVIKSWLYTGNPFYPLLYERFGGPEWSQQLAAQHAAWQQSIGMGRSPLDYLLLPLRVILRGDFGYQHFDGQIHWAWILLVPLALLAAGRERRSRHLFAVAALYFVLWSVTSQQMRLLIPVLPLLSIPAARGLVGLLVQLRPSIRKALEISVALAVAAALFHSSWIYLRQSPRLVRDLVTRGAALKESVVHPVYRWIDANLPPDSRLLLINTNRGFHLPRPYDADSFFEASQITDTFLPAQSPGEALVIAHRIGITHVLVENRPGPAYPEALALMLRSPDFGRVLHSSSDGRFVVLELRPAS